MAIRDADLSSDGRSIVMITFDSQHQPSPGKLEQWTSATTRPLDVQQQFLTTVRFSPDGRLIAVGTRTGTLLFFDVESHARLEQHAIATGQGIIPSLEFSPDGRRLATTGQNNTVKIFDLEFGKQGELQSVRESQTLGPFDLLSWSVAFSPDGKRLLIGRSATELWQLEPQEMLRTVPGSAVAFSPDGETFATGGGELTTSLRIWKTETGEVVHKLAAGHDCPVFAIAFSPSGKRIVSGSRSFEPRMLGKVRCWDAATGEPWPDFGEAK
jgi:WD40 repeat protein